MSNEEERAIVLAAALALGVWLAVQMKAYASAPRPHHQLHEICYDAAVGRSWVCVSKPQPEVTCWRYPSGAFHCLPVQHPKKAKRHTWSVQNDTQRVPRLFSEKANFAAESWGYELFFPLHRFVYFDTHVDACSVSL